jgi:hypothetical protein
MLEANVRIDKDLAVKGFRRALKYKAFQNISYFYAIRLMIVWLVISLVNALWGQGYLTSAHLVVLGVLWLGISIHGYYKWDKELAETTEGWEFIARLDDDGVFTYPKDRPEDEARYEWSFYHSYREYEDYLEITDINRNVTFLPKTAELLELIEFTKNKIPEHREARAVV